MAAFLIAPMTEFVGLESRFALFAETMLREGPSFFPRTYLGPYPDYPATCTFLIYLPARLLGHLTPLLAILPTAIISSLILVATYKIGSLHSRIWGWCAVLMSLLTGEFVLASRSISPDQCTTLVTSFCVLWTLRDIFEDRRGIVWKFAIAFAAGFACRGPIGMVLPAVVVIALHLAEGQFRRAVFIGMISAIVLSACVGLLILSANHDGGPEFVGEVLKMQMLGRFSGAHSSAITYWIRSSGWYAAAFPLAAAVMIFSSRRLLAPKDFESRLLRSLAVWALIVLAVLSIPGDKKARYILPASPAFALIAAYYFTSDLPTLFLRRCKDVVVGIFNWTPVICLISASVILLFHDRFTPPLKITRVVAAVALLTLIAFTNFWWRRSSSTKLTSSGEQVQDRRGAIERRLAFAAISFLTIQIGVVETILVREEGCASFRKAVATGLSHNGGRLVFWRLGPDQEDIKLMAGLKSDFTPGFAGTTDELFKRDPSTLFITRHEEFEGMPDEVSRRIVVSARGKIGHELCVAFRLAATRRARLGDGPELPDEAVEITNH
ncbi:MAG: glycosyltransferase family 39 protein [Planctomycetes bacterium]|nr:glycosyltransferase family 39 protein [Planctomycetota bacterium]